MKGRNARGNESERMTDGGRSDDGQEQRMNEWQNNRQELIDEGTIANGVRNERRKDRVERIRGRADDGLEGSTTGERTNDGLERERVNEG